MRPPDSKAVRDNITYGVGALGTIYVTIFAEGSMPERLPFLVVFVGIITGPAFLRKDDKVKEKSRAKAEEEAE